MSKIRTGEAFEADVRLTVIGEQLRVGDKAPDFALDALGPGEAAPREITLASGAGRVRLLHVVNSLDTPVCHVGAHRFEQLRAAKLPSNVDVYTVSMDLPYAQARWRGAESVAHEALSSHKSEAFGRDYGVLLKEWRLLQRQLQRRPLRRACRTGLRQPRPLPARAPVSWRHRCPFRRA